MDLETLRRRCIDAYVVNYERHLQALDGLNRMAKELRSGGNVPPEEIAGNVERFRVLEGKRQAHISKRMIDRVKKEGQAEIAEQVARMKAVYEKSEIILF